MTVSQFVCFGQPLGKPRMTQRDRWKQRPCVVQYWKWCDKLRAKAGLRQKLTLTAPHKLYICAWFQLPSRLTKKRLTEVSGTYHTCTPDWDNVAKGVMDALLVNDSMVSIGRVCKFWDDGDGPRVEIVLEEI